MKTPPPKPLFILEMANNHMGNLKHGLRVVREFAAVVKDFPFEFAFKLQYRDLDTFIHPAYRERADLKHVRRFLETRLTEAEFRVLKAEIAECGFRTMCTPFDEKSVDLVVEHGYDFLKIGSCSFTDWPLLEKIATVDKPIIASTGGASLAEMDRVVSFFEHRSKNLALMHCVAQYPTATPDMQLNQLKLLRQRYPNLRLGFSTHEDPNDTEVVMVAVGAGATIFERHVAVPTEKFAANAYSSSPEQFCRWLAAARKAYALCGAADERVAGTPGELAQLHGLRRGVFARRKINAGEQIGPQDCFLAMPAADGQLVANQLSKFSVFTAAAPIEANAPLLLAALEHVDHQARVHAILQDVKKALKKSRITLPTARSDLEISHHYGLEKFYEHGAVLLNFINREYCKKLIVMLPGQRHPEHFHKQKEETFYVVHGEMDIVLDGVTKTCKAGDLLLVQRGVKHSFSTRHGVIFEEISSTHYQADSFYTDPAIMLNQRRKTLLTYWMN
jgi:sialic acid synthase SpsE/mannose-6-phosphate isomerase-like protein (cupin superfamily)